MISHIKAKTDWVKLPDVLSGLTLFLASLFFFYDIFTSRFLFTERDLGPYFIPPRFFWVESIERGDFPLWNPFQFCGHPFFANPQHAILYPLNSLFLILPFDLAFNSIIILHFFLGGFFTYLLLRDIKVSSTGSLISGLIFMLGGYLLSVHSLLSCLLSVIWAPLILMFFRRAVARPGFKNEILVAIFMAISFLGGGIEIIYGNFIVLLFMVIFSPQMSRQGVSTSPINLPNPPRFRVVPTLITGGEGGLWSMLLRTRSLAIVSILFLLLSAIQFIPFIELWIHSIRGKGISYQEATVWSFAPKDILLFFLPDAYGYFLDMKRYWVGQCWLKTLYTGGLPFILSLLFFLFGKGRRLYILFILLSLFLSFGQYNPLYPFLFKYVPFFNGIRYPVKFLYLFILVLSVTSGLGFQRLAEISKEGDKKKLKNGLMIFSLASGLLLLFLVLNHKGVETFLKLRGVDSPHFNHLSVNLYHAKRFLFYLTLFFLLMRFGYELKWKGWTKALFIFFLTADLLGNMGFYGFEKTSDYFKKTKILEIVTADQGQFRTFTTGKTISMDTPLLIESASPFNVFKEKHLPSMNLIYRLHDVWGIDMIRLKKVDDLYNVLTGAPSISETNLVDLYGIKYVISITPLEKEPGYELIYAKIEGLPGKKEDLIQKNIIKLYKKSLAHPRAWVVKEFRVLGAKEILSILKGKDFHLDKEVLLEEKPLDVTPNSVRSADLRFLRTLNSFSAVPEFLSESNNRLTLRVKTGENGFLVLSDTYYPGWKVYVDREERKIYRANYTCRAVPLRAGTHLVEFVYDPLSFKLGAVITFLTFIGCFGIGWISRRKRGRVHLRAEALRCAGTEGRPYSPL